MLARAVIVAVMLLPAACWAFYKPMRVLAPEWNGVSCISEEVCVENRASYGKAMALYESALKFVNSAIDSVYERPRITFCETAECLSRFGFHSPVKAVTVGLSGIVVGPEGWSEYLIRHEIIHHLQAERMGIIDQWLSPNWFKEGMAYSLSGDPRELKEPLLGYRKQFENWYHRIGKARLWNEAEQL